jgi:hypothetical protein
VNVDAAPPPVRPSWRRRRSRELRAAATIVTVLALAGVPLGLIWAWWSPPGPRALLFSGGQVQPEESEAFVAGDGRFAILVVVAGLLAGLVAWFAKAVRGTIVLLALAAGGLVGAAVTVLVGSATGGGTASGKVGTVVDELPLSLHATGLLFLEAAAAVFVYGLCVSFAAADDLGHPDPERWGGPPPPPPPAPGGRHPKPEP